MSEDQNTVEWSKEENWSLFYFSKKDSRWLVPKRNRMGWTFNLGQTKGALAFLACLILPFLITIGSILSTLFIQSSLLQK